MQPYLYYAAIAIVVGFLLGPKIWAVIVAFKTRWTDKPKPGEMVFLPAGLKLHFPRPAEDQIPLDTRPDANSALAAYRLIETAMDEDTRKRCREGIAEWLFPAKSEPPATEAKQSSEVEKVAAAYSAMKDVLKILSGEDAEPKTS